DITRSRTGGPQAVELAQNLKVRDEAMGGSTPLADTTKRQAEALVNKLNASQNEVEYELFIGLKHIDPFIEDAVESMSNHGIKEAVSVVLAPHYSGVSVGSYDKRAKAEGEKYGITIKSVESFYGQAPFIDFWTEAVKSSLMEIPEAELQDTAVVVSAHRLPEKIKEHSDPYPDQLEETAELIKKHAD